LQFKSLQSYQRRPKHKVDYELFCIRYGHQLSDLLFPLLDDNTSPQLVSNISSILDCKVSSYHSHRLADQFEFFYFGGIVLNNKGVVKVQKRIFLCAYGVTHEDKHEMIDFMLSLLESQKNTWEGLLIITDGEMVFSLLWKSSYPGYPNNIAEPVKHVI